MAHAGNRTMLSPLHRADGSAAYKSDGYTIICAVNGPMEVQRRDELPEEAAVDVIVRPASGLGGVRERHLESIIQSTLRQVILVSAHPRTLIQVTFQIVASPEDSTTTYGLPQAASNLPVLPALLQTSVLALLSTSIPLSVTLTSTLIAIAPGGQFVTNPTPKQLKIASSVHVLAFSSLGDLVVMQSEGDFSIDVLEEVHHKASQICRGQEEDNNEVEDVDMASQNDQNLEDMLRSIIQDKVTKEQRWKQSLG